MSEQTDTKEWTLMFYFASDNPLAPEIVSQLKMLKNAGYHQQVNVVAYFDPLTVGTPAHIFDVNAFEKLRTGRSKIGFGRNDPFIRNLMFDKLWDEETGRDGTTSIRDLIQAHAIKKPGLTYDLPRPPRPEPPHPGNHAEGSDTDLKPPRASNGASDADGDSDQNLSLKAFLDFCAKEEKYKAKHYMLFILGHGLVVGDDVFLFDEHAASHSVTLSDLGEALNKFKKDIKSVGEFELVSFHSCSMSSLEVAFELQDTANYMLASQGPAFVGSWPYRQILLRLFNDVAQGKLDTPQDVNKMLRKIFRYVIHNSTDYLLAGYSFDLCLCDLRGDRIETLAGPIQKLSTALTNGLPKPDDEDPAKKMVTNCILLAHWKSQSYFNENYTDLFDFCFCLHDYCEQFSQATGTQDPYKAIQDACDNVMKALKKKDASPILLAKFAGPESQYSHGFSLFFPWTRPTADRTIMREDKDHKTAYERYRFNETTWFDFLKAYWGPIEQSEMVSGTMRDTFKEEIRKITAQKENGAAEAAVPKENKFENLVEDIASLMFNSEGLLNTNSTLSNPTPPKPNPQSSTGDGCTCGSIKNYRRDTRRRSERSESANPTFQSSLRAFAQKKI